MKEKKHSNITRYTVLSVIMVAIFATIAGRLLFLQVVKGQEYKEQSNNKSLTEIQEPAPRGKILDKDGNILATSNQSYVLIYNQTDENDKTFFPTMSKVFKILDESGESQKDDFELKINPYRFEFRSDDEETRKNLEIKFKRDRGLNDEIEKKIKSKNKNISEDDLKSLVNKELLKITPEDTFKKLIAKYKISSAYSLEDQRRYMIIKDTLKMQSYSGYKPVTVASNIKKDTAFKFLQMSNELPGIDVDTQPIRYYPNNELGSSFIGYISKISSDYDKYKEKGYDVSSDYVGQAGIEGALEDRLKGSKGGKIVKLDKNGKIVQELGTKDPSPGETVQLTVDSKVQKAAEDSLDTTMAKLRANPYGQNRSDTTNATRGAAVAIDVNTGAIIAMASRPGYDPNMFAQPGMISQDLYQQYFNPDLGAFGKEYIEKRNITSNFPGETEDQVLNTLFPLDTSIKNNTTIRQDVYDIYPKPFYNYATQSLIPPGSTFKPMTAVAGLESGAINPGFCVDDEGQFDQGGKIVKFILDGRNGVVDLAAAIQKSSNPYFMTVGKLIRQALGDDGLAKYAWKFGLGVPVNSDVKASTGIEIPEKFGQVYNTVSNKNTYASTYLWQTMAYLRDGQDDKGHKLVSLNLYDNSSDSSKVKQIKNDIKTLIKNSVKDGKSAFDKAKYKELFSELVKEDPNNKKDISDEKMDDLIDVIYSITVSDANAQLKVPANIENAAIGQGLNQFTPVQMANYIATLVNGGTRYKVHLVDKYLNSNGGIIEQVKPEVIQKTGISPETIAAIKAGMGAVNEKGGTGSQVFGGFPISTGGKTGTASLGNQDQIGRTDYSEYVAFAPLDKPEIAVYAVIFDGGQGASGAAYVARDILSAYFTETGRITTSAPTSTSTQQNSN
ncbi:penicillin-binding transpeptidase domain-containing protein [Clostridium autoethanogenum]|uniref:Penicillin-binding transpeptidase domain-containing protein n=1 Tax=Clostridium autoethanogenum DSM 10061 TaxID=1341692 RepID=A0ABN4BJC4_9CLOT|nr:penicillin-binding transpeptidase domain-containing protein [Clostridium autoethanogenum]AGY77024.1 penicillin-binding transpeptidase domain-containing protein [Clostridium autoethanogenum DSM 10061]ALU37166.1 Penicillin-binding Protein dimerization domain [Clostridium autoethanogenum DSM 10061]OVY50261.1 Penicillin-binding protein 2B [Clostridium autoethanogenum]